MNTFLKNKSKNLGITFPSKIYFEKYLVSKVHPSLDLKNILTSGDGFDRHPSPDVSLYSKNLPVRPASNFVNQIE